MFEHQMLRVQHHALRLLLQPRIRFPTIHRIAEQNMPQRFQVNADLMRPPRVNRTPHERRHVAEFLHHLPIRVRVLPAIRRLHHRHLVPVLFIAPDRFPDRAADQRRRARHEREILLLQRPLRKLLRESAMRLVRLRHENDTRRLAIEPVHDPRPLHAADPAQRPLAVREQRMHERVLARRRPRVHDHARRLVDREQVLVLENHLERNLHRRQFRRLHIGKRELDLVTAHDRRIAPEHHTAAPHEPRVERPLERRA